MLSASNESGNYQSVIPVTCVISNIIIIIISRTAIRNTVARIGATQTIESARTHHIMGLSLLLQDTLHTELLI